MVALTPKFSVEIRMVSNKCAPLVQRRSCAPSQVLKRRMEDENSVSVPSPKVSCSLPAVGSVVDPMSPSCSGIQHYAVLCYIFSLQRLVAMDNGGPRRPLAPQNTTRSPALDEDDSSEQPALSHVCVDRLMVERIQRNAPCPQGRIFYMFILS